MTNTNEFWRVRLEYQARRLHEHFAGEFDKVRQWVAQQHRPARVWGTDDITTLPGSVYYVSAEEVRQMRMGMDEAIQRGLKALRAILRAY